MAASTKLPSFIDGGAAKTKALYSSNVPRVDVSLASYIPGALALKGLGRGSAPPKTSRDFERAIRALSRREAQLPDAIAPEAARPVVTIGAGSIVRDAHGPAYAMLGLRRIGIYDPNLAAAHDAANALGYETHFTRLTDAVRVGEELSAVFDLALPPSEIISTLEQLPDDSAVLIQKPLGKTLAEAASIDSLCSERRLRVGVNFQLPFSPQIAAAVGAVQAGLLGTLSGANVVLDLKTEWSLWDFVLREPRIEVLLHSIHYLSLFAFYLGEPSTVASTQSGDPEHPILRDRDVCSDTTLSYDLDGTPFSVGIHCNHLSSKARDSWRSELVLEGTHGRLVARIADNLDYPNGVDDALSIEHSDFGRREVTLVGNRFPMAFVATMTHLQRALVDGSEPQNSLDFGTTCMRLAETCYRSNAARGAPLAVAPLR